MTLALPDQWFPGVDQFEMDDPEKLSRQLAEFRDGVQRNFEKVALTFPLGSQHLTGTPGTWTPTWTGSGSNPAIGNGTLAGSYRRHGTLVKVDIHLAAGTTTTFGTGVYNLTLPFAPAARYQLLLADVFDAGTQHYPGQAIIGNGGALTFNEIVVTTNALSGTNWQHNVPFTFGNTDRLLISGVYEAA